MSALAPIGAKLALIVPRLGSPHDGEIVASVKAIERTLKSAGCDWHDLSAAIGAAAAPPRSNTDAGHAPIWSELDRARRQGWHLILFKQTWLTEWERGFVLSIAERMVAAPFGRQTAKQEIILNRLISRASAYGVRP